MTESISNCYICDKCIRSKNKEYICTFKNCLMGDIPYFPKFIPKDAMVNYGIKVCDFKKTKEKLCLK